MKVLTGMCSLQGKREKQQDNYGVLQLGDFTFIAVCDGNGGSRGGEISRLAVSAVLSECLEFSRDTTSHVISEDYFRATGLKIMSNTATQVLFEKRKNDWIEGGTTVTLVILAPYFISTFWIGDSPACLCQGDEITHLITPHTLMTELMKSGVSWESLQQQSGISSVITQCVGHEQATPDANVRNTSDSGFVIIGSDGLFNFVSDDEILHVLKSKSPRSADMQVLAEQLAEQAGANNSDDNISVVVARYSQDIK